MTIQDHFTVTLSSEKKVTLDAVYQQTEARFCSPDKAWNALMKRDSVQAAPNVCLAPHENYPGLTTEETKELYNVIATYGPLSWIEPGNPYFNNV
ncbi:hypothetical protein GCM10011415_06370 [Salipiger pallidus]|uniref:Uncharacterized protein n=1 Tax=Salipiger pallidus TaxID=1775170 RepID=A0A8J2ZGW6_9RHOB|nr:hypothetical protein [Salipiger pallidus]GGG62745.1 hypothetical protein GCM10011415_06370 [Salipiger pallidus]